MHLGQQSPLFAVGTEMDEIELEMVIDETNDLSPGVAGRSDDCDRETHLRQYTSADEYAHMRIHVVLALFGGSDLGPFRRNSSGRTVDTERGDNR